MADTLDLTKLVYGYNAPFLGGHQGVLSRQSGSQIIRNDLLQLLLTVPRERVGRPTYGTIIRSSLFSQLDSWQVDIIAINVREAIKQFEPRVQANVNIYADTDNNLLVVLVFATLTSDPTKSIDLELRLPLEPKSPTE